MTNSEELNAAYAAMREALFNGVGTNDAEELLFKHVRLMARNVSWHVLHQSDEDFVQDVSVNILLDMHTFKGDSAFSTWAFQVARNAAISELRKRRKFVSLEKAEDVPAPGAFEQSVALEGLYQELKPDEGALLTRMLEPDFSVRSAAEEIGIHHEILRRRVLKLKRRLEVLGYGQVGE